VRSNVPLVEPSDFVGVGVVRRRGLAAASAMVAVGLSWAVLACGSDEESVATDPSISAAFQLTRNTVTNREVMATKPGSPQRAVLEWFQAVQFQDGVAARELMDPTALAGLRLYRLDRALRLIAPSIAKPKIVRTLSIGSRTTVRVLLISYASGKKDPVLALPHTLSVTGGPGHWRVDDRGLLLEAVAGALKRPG
jgi:hypothetical protein